MQIITRVRPTPADPEQAIFKLSQSEHLELKKNPTKFINEKKVFTEPVSDARVQHQHPDEPVVAPAAAPAVGAMWVVSLIHLPACNVIGCCIPQSALG